MADDKSKNGWGGRRPGAGRKRRSAAPTAVPPAELTAALTAPPPAEIETVAAPHAQSSVDALARQLVAGLSDHAKILAAKTVLDRAFGKPVPESGGDLMLPFFGTRPARPLPNEIRTTCRQLAPLAISVLVKIRDHSLKESARVAAAKVLLDRGIGAAAPARLPDDHGDRPLGKKAELDVAARNPDAATPMGRLMAERNAQITGGGRPH